MSRLAASLPRLADSLLGTGLPRLKVAKVENVTSLVMNIMRGNLRDVLECLCLLARRFRLELSPVDVMIFIFLILAVLASRSGEHEYVTSYYLSCAATVGPSLDAARTSDEALAPTRPEQRQRSMKESYIGVYAAVNQRERDSRYIC